MDAKQKVFVSMGDFPSPREVCKPRISWLGRDLSGPRPLSGVRTGTIKDHLSIYEVVNCPINLATKSQQQQKVQNGYMSSIFYVREQRNRPCAE